MLKFTKDSYCNVKDWPQELVEKAAEMMCEDTGSSVVDDNKLCVDALDVINDYCHFLVYTSLLDGVGVFGGSVADNKTEITRQQVEQMIKERENKTGESFMSPIEKAKEAADNFIQAEKDYQKALEELQSYLGEGFKIELTMKIVSEAQSQIDIPPEEWQEGDLIECINAKEYSYFTEGKIYTFKEKDKYGDTYVKEDDEGDEWYLSGNCFKFHSRPN